jgi:hypothetical protein
MRAARDVAALAEHGQQIIGVGVPQEGFESEIPHRQIMTFLPRENKAKLGWALSSH